MARKKDLLSVDGTLIRAWASQKSFRPKDESDDEGSAAKMTYLGHTVIANRNGLIVKTQASLADGFGER